MQTAALLQLFQKCDGRINGRDRLYSIAFLAGFGLEWVWQDGVPRSEDFQQCLVNALDSGAITEQDGIYLLTAYASEIVIDPVQQAVCLSLNATETDILRLAACLVLQQQRGETAPADAVRRILPVTATEEGLQKAMALITRIQGIS